MVNTYAVQSGGCRFESLWGFGFYLKSAHYEVDCSGKKTYLAGLQCTLTSSCAKMGSKNQKDERQFSVFQFSFMALLSHWYQDCVKVTLAYFQTCSKAVRDTRHAKNFARKRLALAGPSPAVQISI